MVTIKARDERWYPHAVLLFLERLHLKNKHVCELRILGFYLGNSCDDKLQVDSTEKKKKNKKFDSIIQNHSVVSSI